MRKIRLRKQNKSIDRTLLFLTLILTVLGLLAVADASAPQAASVFSDKFYFVKQQIVWAGTGLAGLLVLSRVKYSFWEKVATPLFFLSIICLILVLIPGVGSRFLGARRWILLGPVSFQPSEFVKLALSIYLAKVAASNRPFLSYLIPLGAVLALIMMQPDLGTAVVVMGTSMAQIFVAGANLFYFLGTGLLGGILGFLLIITSNYRRERLATLFSISQDPLGRSYQIRQILLALGSGGLFGVGLGESRQKYLFLPEAATDSIFAIIAEEVGFVGAIALLSLFLFFIIKGIKIASSAPDRFSQVLSSGLVAWLGFQTFLNVASITALVPLTGIPLPFFSYGGSSLIMTLLAVGILLNISKYTSK